MDIPTALTLFSAGLAGGIAAGLVGGGSLITFPTLVYVGLPPLVATASNIVALTFSNITAAFGDFKRMPPWSRTFRVLAVVSVLGSIMGSSLLLLTPERYFTVAVPALMGTGTALFALSERIKRGVQSRSTSLSGQSNPIHLQVPIVAVSALYGSYFGTNFTGLLLAALSLGGGDFRAMMRWPRLFGQFFRFDEWSLCRG